MGNNKAIINFNFLKQKGYCNTLKKLFLNPSPKIVSINHGIYSENNLSYVLRKDEFDKNDNSLFYSPKPDIFLTQGIKYFKRLKKIFPYKKVYPIGSFKYELADY